jgi:choline kinase
MEAISELRTGVLFLKQFYKGNDKYQFIFDEEVGGKPLAGCDMEVVSFEKLKQNIIEDIKNMMDEKLKILLPQCKNYSEECFTKSSVFHSEMITYLMNKFEIKEDELK